MDYQNEINAAIAEYYRDNGISGMNNVSDLRDFIQIRGLDNDEVVIRQMRGYINSAIQLAQMITGAAQ